MDDGSKTNKNLEKNLDTEHSDDMFNVGNVLQSAWIRRAFQSGDGLDGQLLDYGFYFLWRCTVFSWLVFLIETIFK